jgi:hypothetical protein
MDGEQLYAMYAAAHALQNCSVEEWSALSEDDRNVWNFVAERLQLKEEFNAGNAL